MHTITCTHTEKEKKIIKIRQNREGKIAWNYETNKEEMPYNTSNRIVHNQFKSI